ncbi:hypothetical protein LZ31DRAFT_378858 [Colletotrichum somersetense]|nr:hypothetical protein LZ31DRAFT_378858 [Colletotrichum somersetense]
MDAKGGGGGGGRECSGQANRDRERGRKGRETGVIGRRSGGCEDTGKRARGRWWENSSDRTGFGVDGPKK